MQRGYTKSWRKKYESKTASRGLLYIGAMDWLVGNANWKDGWHDGDRCERGQLFVGRNQLSKAWRVSQQTVRTILRNLETDEFLTIKPTNKGSVITVLNYDIYQDESERDQPADQPVTNQLSTSDQPLPKKDKNIIEDSSLRSESSSPKQSAPRITFGYESDGKIRGITKVQLDLWKENFPGIDVEVELGKASAWLDANRKQRKSDIKRFLVNWLMRAQEKSRPGRPPASSAILKSNPVFEPGERGVGDAW